MPTHLAHLFLFSLIGMKSEHEEKVAQDTNIHVHLNWHGILENSVISMNVEDILL